MDVEDGGVALALLEVGRLDDKPLDRGSICTLELDLDLFSKLQLIQKVPVGEAHLGQLAAGVQKDLFRLLGLRDQSGDLAFGSEIEGPDYTGARDQSVRLTTAGRHLGQILLALILEEEVDEPAVWRESGVADDPIQICGQDLEVTP